MSFIPSFIPDANISVWNSTTVYQTHSIVSIGNSLYWCRLPNVNTIPVGTNIDNTEVGLGHAACIWSQNYFFWVPSYSSKIDAINLNRRFDSTDGGKLIRNEKVNKNNQQLTLIFDKRTDLEAAAILEFIRYKKGAYSFDFSPQTPYNIINQFVGNSPKHTYVFSNNNSVEVTFRIVY